MSSNVDHHELTRLAELIRCRNQIEREISAVIGHPAALGYLGEYIAARVFSIHLTKNTAHQAIDGYFHQGPLAPCSVNIKWYAVREGLLDIIPGFLPDYYLVMTGPLPTLTSQLQIRSRPWVIHAVYLFDANKLVDNLEERGVRIGASSSIRRDLWEAAEIYPKSINPLFSLTPAQHELLEQYR